MATADLTKATRELFVRSLVNQVYYKVPFVEELQRRRQITHTAGLYVERLVDYKTIEDIVQVYTTNQPLTDQKETYLQKPRFTWRKWQMPLRYDVDEELENMYGGKEIQLLNLARHLVQKGQKDIKLWLSAQIFNSGSTTPIADGTVTALQSLVSGLDHDTAYGTLTRTFSTSTNDWWQGADPSGLSKDVSTSGQGTAWTLTKANIRKWVNETDVAHYMEGADDIMILMCPTLWNKLAAQLEAHLEYKAGSKQSQGIRSMIFDGHEIVSVPYLQRSSTTKTWLFILNLRHWELRIHSHRNFKLTDFEWQGKNANGYDYELARILGQGNFVCWKPNSSMWLSNVS